MRKLKRLLLVTLSWFAAIVFLIEEAIWDWTAALMAKLGAVRLVRAIEARITALLPPLGVGYFPAAQPDPHPGQTHRPARHRDRTRAPRGGVFLLAKLLGMALFSRIFNLTRPHLCNSPGLHVCTPS